MPALMRFWNIRGLSLPCTSLLAFILLITSFNEHELLAATPITGSQSGTLTLSNSPYLVTADLFVPGGQILTIEPGGSFNFKTPTPHWWWMEH